MNKPKCPKCEISGTEYIISEESDEKTGAPDFKDPMFYIVYCSKCGHIYGIFNKIMHPPTVPGFQELLQKQL